MTKLLALLLLATCSGAAPRLTQTASTAVLANDHLSATIDLANGGWLAQLADAAGHVYAGGGRVYSDYGLFEPRGLVGTVGQRDTRLDHAAAAGRLWVTVSSAFRAEQAVRPEAGVIACQIRYGLGDEADLDMEVALTPSRELPGRSAFLAAVLDVSGLSEWLAWTLDGRINELIRQDGRAFQSALTPFDPGRAELVLLYRDGRRLTVGGLGSDGVPLANVFLHTSRTGGGALFVALLDGEAPTWPAGQTWRARWRLRLS